ncbi:type I-E CRISPR-associated protein Cse1/CasA [Dactylosporangium sp. NPDC000244]|uniref:type I-E CRISPR-associated protein Cse1/CasA n=1 Tax=Dactylosporangium sp. NPDC000244 TaxID=3154365 RepID=UPI0033168B11
MFSFDLTTDPWIPVMTRDGRQTVSLRVALLEAHHLLGVALDSPLEAVALFRQVLLPVYLDALFVDAGCRYPRTPREWSQLWAAAVLDRHPPWADPGPDAKGPIDAYLDRYRDRFQVFGTHPLAQVATLRAVNGETKPVSVLIASAASGNNVPLFSARTEATPPTLSPAEAIRATLATHCWDTAAIKSGADGDPMVRAGKTTGNPTGPLGGIGVVLPLGNTLAQTLLLHVPVTSATGVDDRPQWRAGPDQHPSAGPGWQQRPVRGLLDLLTWQARRIRLVPEAGPDGTTVIRRVVLSAGDRMTRLPDEIEPHTAWRMSKNSKEQVPVRHTVGQSAWRGMLPMLATAANNPHGSSPRVLGTIRDLQDHDRDQLPIDYPLRVLTVGVQYGNQSAVVEDLIVDLLPMPLAALNADSSVYQLVEAMVSQADDLRMATNRLGDELRLAAGGEKLTWDKGDRLGDRMVHAFNPVAREVLSRLQRRPDDIDATEELWLAEARRIVLTAAEGALNAVPPETFIGRVHSLRDIYRAAAAEARFRAAIRSILGEPVPAGTPSGGA